MLIINECYDLCLNDMPMSWEDYVPGKEFESRRLVQATRVFVQWAEAIPRGICALQNGHPESSE